MPAALAVKRIRRQQFCIALSGEKEIFSAPATGGAYFPLRDGGSRGQSRETPLVQGNLRPEFFRASRC